MVNYKSKHAIVKRPQYSLYMAMTDMRNLVGMLPEDKRQDISADFDTLTASVRGITIGVKVWERVPYSKISVIDNGAPFAFKAEFHFDEVPGSPLQTEFSITLDADLNQMMKLMVGSKIQKGLDAVVQGLADISEGRMPEGFDPSKMPEGFDPESLKNMF